MTDSGEKVSWRKHVTETGVRRLKELMEQIPNFENQKSLDMSAAEHLKRYSLDEGGKVWCPVCHKRHVLHYWDDAKDYPKNVVFEYHLAEMKSWLAQSTMYKKECFFCRQNMTPDQMDPFLTERLSGFTPLSHFVCKECAKKPSIETKVNEIARHKLLTLGGQ